eukprot:TRINITY_DN113038_c0_g1_i1.p1 TRINITY_DN113038_c0_g1~~TRINITY_DN113038_c0_g1_i1.p1  ORF type:complete len:632 (+),score=113.71 TRINITY_DN113038_c0_g1_i1:33-1898(+)
MASGTRHASAGRPTLAQMWEEEGRKEELELLDTIANATSSRPRLQDEATSAVRHQEIEQLRCRIEELKQTLCSTRAANLREVCHLRQKIAWLESELGKPCADDIVFDWSSVPSVGKTLELETKLEAMQDDLAYWKLRCETAEEKMGQAHQRMHVLKAFAVRRAMLFDRAMQLSKFVVQSQGYVSVAHYLKERKDYSSENHVLSRQSITEQIQREVEENVGADESWLEFTLDTAKHESLDEAIKELAGQKKERIAVGIQETSVQTDVSMRREKHMTTQTDAREVQDAEVQTQTISTPGRPRGRGASLFEGSSPPLRRNSIAGAVPVAGEASQSESSGRRLSTVVLGQSFAGSLAFGRANTTGHEADFVTGPWSNASSTLRRMSMTVTGLQGDQAPALIPTVPVRRSSVHMQGSTPGAQVLLGRISLSSAACGEKSLAKSDFSGKEADEPKEQTEADDGSGFGDSDDSDADVEGNAEDGQESRRISGNVDVEESSKYETHPPPVIKRPEASPRARPAGRGISALLQRGSHISTSASSFVSQTEASIDIMNEITPTIYEDASCTTQENLLAVRCNSSRATGLIRSHPAFAGPAKTLHLSSLPGAGLVYISGERSFLVKPKKSRR